MLPLAGPDFPKSAGELKTALAAGLARIGAESSIDLEGNLPHLHKLAIECSGIDVARMAIPRGTAGSHFEVENFVLAVAPVRYEGLEGILNVAGEHVTAAFQRSDDHDAALTITNARAGTLEIAVSRREIEKFVLQVARDAAGAQGVSVESARLSVAPAGNRAVTFAAEIVAKKLFFAATIHLTGKLSIDDALSAHASELRCDGDGVIGSLACGFLAPYLQRFEGRKIDLAAFALGDLKPTGVSLDAGDPLRVTAQFGSAT